MAFADARPLTATETRVIERNAVALGITIDNLMENAGRAIAEEAALHLPPAPARVGVVAGVGNNGGDGFAAAHYLSQWGYTPELWVVRPPSEIRSGAARRCFERVQGRLPTHARLPRAEELAALPLVIDALLGTGQGGALRPPYSEAVALIRSAGIPVLSIDVPTGLGSHDALAPRWTVALTALKEGMTATNSGEISVREIGIPFEAWRSTGPGEFAYFATSRPGRLPGRHGRVLVIGGGPYSGAPALAGLAAIRSGAERATVLAPEPAARSIQGFSPDLVVLPVGRDAFQSSDSDAILQAVEGAKVDAVAMGMGAGRSPGTLELFRQLLSRLPPALPLVVDADALGALPMDAERATRRTGAVVATPNEGEFARYFGGAAPGSPTNEGATAVSAAGKSGATLVVKGDRDRIASEGREFENRHHPDSLPVGGTGDVLAGVIVAQLARGIPALGAARLGTYWVGEAGERAARRAGYGLIASDVLVELGPALADGLVERA